MGGRDPAEAPRDMLWFAGDLPNLCSLAGLMSAILGIYFAVLHVYGAAMIALVWSVVFDWFDGRVARGMKRRTDEQRAFGAQLDSLIDVVSFGVAPAVLLLSVGGFRPWFLPGAFVVLAAGVIRLSYFNLFGLSEGSMYRGLALDNNVIVLALLFAFQRTMTGPLFAVVLYGALMVLAVLNVAPLHTPKLAGNWYYAIVAYAAAVSVLFGWQLLALR
jgi:phosphatidylserine synthase